MCCGKSSGEAITHGRLLGQTKPFLHEMVFAVRDLMQDAYPELDETATRVSKSRARRRGLVLRTRSMLGSIALRGRRHWLQI